MDDARFLAAWSLAETIEGWLTRDQAAQLFEAARSLCHDAVMVEIGSHHGRSTVMLASALPPGARLVAVDPFDPAWRYGGADTRARLMSNLTSAGVADRVEILPTTSRAARAAYHGAVAALYVDGKHDVWTVLDDLRWAGRVPDGGLVFVHDAFSSLGVTLALMATLPGSRRLTYAGRTGSLARLEVRPPRPRERLGPVAELPWWVRNLAVKVLLRARLRSLARVLGHRSAIDPY